MTRFPRLVLSLLALAACDDPVRPGRAAPFTAPRPSLSVAAGVTITPLVHLPDRDQAFGTAINDLGQIAGITVDDADMRLVEGIIGTLWPPTGDPQSLVAPDFSYGLYDVRGINNQGQVVGRGRAPGGFYWHAVLWTAAGGVQDLGVLPGHVFSGAWGINDVGQVVGWSSGLGAHTAFRWSASEGMRSLGVLPGYTYSDALGINNLGQVVGYSRNANESPEVRRAFLWTAEGGMQDLGALPGHSQSEAWDINDQGQVVGFSYAPGSERAFLWTAAGGMRDLGTLGGSRSRAYGINNLGQVVGSSETATGKPHAFVWTESHGMEDLGTLPGSVSSFAMDINERQQIVGASEYRAVVWTLGARLSVAIDIKPGDATNSINLTDQGHAKIPVAVLSTPAFDARLVVPASVQLGETAVSARRNGSLFASLDDVDGDGDLDLVVHFERAQLLANGDLTSATTELTLIATLTDGRQAEGRDAVRAVP